jgi:hypothetical protein
MTTDTAAIDEAIDGAVRVAENRGYEGEERRTNQRLPFGEIMLTLLTEEPGVIQRVLVQAKNISTTGLGVISRQMIHPGREGITDLVRSDGKVVQVGVRVVRCHYCGAMVHSTGLEFIAVPKTLAGTQAEAETWAKWVQKHPEAAAHEKPTTHVSSHGTEAEDGAAGS